MAKKKSPEAAAANQVINDNADDDVLSDEEIMLFDQCDRDRKELPENFTPWEDVRKA